MATISTAVGEKVFSVKGWLGLNEHPDGDTRLKMGEASKMVNWRVTRDGNLKRRPGLEFIAGLCGDYSASVSDDVELITTFESADDIITIYDNISASYNPGTISLVEPSGFVDQGVWEAPDSTVEEGVFETAESVPMTVSNGVLEITADVSGTEVTIAGLQAMLAELDDGEYLYTEYMETIYALNVNSLDETNSGYVLSGYPVTAVPNDGPQKIAGLWAGLAGGKEVLLAACNGKIWNLYDATNRVFSRSYLGAIATGKGVNFIPFGGNVYIQNGYNYYVYNGSAISEVAGYDPLVAIGIGPTGSNNTGELTGFYVNRLTPKRRVWISPDGTNKVFPLPEKGLKTIDYVKDLSTGSNLATGWTGDAANGTVTFTAVPARAVNSYEIGYSAKTHTDDSSIPDYRAQVTGNLFAELYSGNTDTGLFIYGDGTNRALYTGMDYEGLPRADYFPDQYEVHVGDSNTPITAMVRHYSELVCYKNTECWSLQYGQIELANGDLTVAVYVTPVNRDKGNAAPGQVRLVENNPVTCSGTELYQWVNSSYYASQISRDERQARRITDRVQSSIKEFDFASSIMWDDNDNQEFYIVQGGKALVWNYAANAWYRYENFNAVQMCNFQGELFYGTPDGKVYRVTDRKMTDDGRAILAEWESGAMDFGASHLRKYSSMLWVGLKPVAGTSVDVCVETDRKNTFREKVVSSTKAKIPGEPFAVRSKIKAKKFVYYRLLLSVAEKMPPVTVTNIDVRVRQTGYAK